MKSSPLKSPNTHKKICWRRPFYKDIVFPAEAQGAEESYLTVFLVKFIVQL